MKRPVQNFLVDAVSFTALLLLATTGLLMFWVLPPGSHQATVWGMSRHEWGDLHFWIAIAFLGLLVLHLVLHWQWIVCMVQGRPRRDPRASMRAAGAVIGVVVLLTLSGALLLTLPEETAVPGERHGTERVVPPGEHPASPARGRGYGRTALDGATLEQVAYALGMTAPELAQALALPDEVAADTPWRRLEHRYGVDAARVRRALTAEAQQVTL